MIEYLIVQIDCTLSQQRLGRRPGQFDQIMRKNAGRQIADGHGDNRKGHQDVGQIAAFVSGYRDHAGQKRAATLM